MPEGEPCDFKLPQDVLRDRPPVYEQVKRNVWTAGAPRPKRLPRDDIPVCCCEPLPPHLAAAADGAAPAQVC